MACLGLSFYSCSGWIKLELLLSGCLSLDVCNSGNNRVFHAGFVIGKQGCGSQHKYLFVMVVQAVFIATAAFQQLLSTVLL